MLMLAPTPKSPSNPNTGSIATVTAMPGFLVDVVLRNATGSA